MEKISRPRQNTFRGEREVDPGAFLDKETEKLRVAQRCSLLYKFWNQYRHGFESYSATY